jgi:hypothetical protein
MASVHSEVQVGKKHPSSRGPEGAFKSLLHIEVPIDHGV